MAFSTRSQSVVTGSSNPSEFLQVYLRDIANGRTYLISGAAQADAGLGMKTVGDADSDFPSMSGDGEWIAWGSPAKNLPGNPTGASNVFMHEVSTATTTLLKSTGGSNPNGATVEPFVSHNGRYISFTSRATNLHNGIGPNPIPPQGCSTAVPNGQPSIYLYDRGDPNSFPAVPPSITWVSLGVSAAGCPESPQTPCTNSSVSANGCFVVYQSRANNITAQSDGLNQQIYMRNMITGTTKLVSHAFGGGVGNETSRNAQISRDGRWVVFASAASDLLPNFADGNGIGDAFVWERTTGDITRVSIDSAGNEITTSNALRNTFLYPHITGNGRFAFFTSSIDEFNNPSGPANFSELYVHDRDYDHDGLYDEDFSSNGVRTIRVSDLPSATTPNLQANRYSGGNCWASNDGQYVVFMGFASDFVDANDVGGVDTNGDAEPQEAACCNGSPPCEPDPGETGRDIFRRTMWEDQP